MADFLCVFKVLMRQKKTGGGGNSLFLLIFKHSIKINYHLYYYCARVCECARTCVHTYVGCMCHDMHVEVR